MSNFNLLYSYLGWGRGVKRAVVNWYLQKNPKQLALEVTRYPGAYSWTHKDVVRMSHIKSEGLATGMKKIYILCNIS